MINSIELNYFKAFEEGKVELSNLNLFTGVNGMGKSSFIQSLLLLRQSYFENRFPNQLVLNGNLAQLGKKKDVFHYLHGADDEKHLKIAIQTSSGPLSVLANGGLDREALDIAPMAENSWVHITENEPVFMARHFQYLYADRVAPTKGNLPVNQYVVETQRSVGNRGEFTGHFLSHYGSEEVALPSVIAYNGEDNRLVNQIDAWLSQITPGARLTTGLNAEFDIARVKYGFGKDQDDATPDFLPVNVGFGFTYALPVITVILAAKPGDLVIIENPESHLHPSGQARMGLLIALAAQDGVQIIVETHSDHVLNGIRVATKQYHDSLSKSEPAIGIDCNKIKVFFFERLAGDSTHKTEIVIISINEKGKMSRWPDGFFDEWKNMLSQLID